jgi:hypothetical protein
MGVASEQESSRNYLADTALLAIFTKTTLGLDRS